MNEENEQMNDTTANDTTANETAQNTANNYRYICTMDNSTFEGKRAIVNARNSALSLNGCGAEPLTVIGAYIAPGVRSQTGQKCANVYLSEKTATRISVSHRESTAACWTSMICSPISTRRTVSLLQSSRPRWAVAVPRNRLKSSSSE